MREDLLLRKLAKQTLSLNHFLAAKEIASIHLFRNQTDLSRYQDMYLSYLYFYHNLNIDISMKKVSEVVLKDIIYEDAYTLWKTKHEDKTDESLDANKKQEVSLVFDD
jgi:hypothetical protein